MFIKIISVYKRLKDKLVSDIELESKIHTHTYSINIYTVHMGFSRDSDGKESACSAGDWGSICGSEIFSGEGMATHSSVLAWKIPLTEETGRL